jgi:putative mRNA 3-end processing factor
MACILDAAADRFGHPDSDSMRIRLVGRAAKFYHALGYDRDRIRAIDRFDDPGELIDRGVVTVAGPRIPNSDEYERSSGRLFNAMRHDPSATLVQLTEPGEGLRTDAHCRRSSFEFVNHPSAEALDTLVGASSPMNVVVVHDQHPEEGKYEDRWDSFWWTPYDESAYTIYDDEWVGPEWAGPQTRMKVETRPPSKAEQRGTSDQLPEVDPGVVLDLDDLGIDPVVLEGVMNELERSFDGSNRRNTTGKYDPYWTSNDDPVQEDETSDIPDVGVDPDTETTKYDPSRPSTSNAIVNSNESGSGDPEAVSDGGSGVDTESSGGDEERAISAGDRLFDTVAPEHRLSEAEIERRAEEAGLDLERIRESLQNDVDVRDGASGEDESTSEEEHSEPAREDESGKGSPEDAETHSEEPGRESRLNETEQSDEMLDEVDHSDASPEDGSVASAACEDKHGTEETDDRRTDQETTDETSDSEAMELTAGGASEEVTVELEPDIRTIAEDRATRESVSIETVVDDAVDQFLRAAVSGTLPIESLPQPGCESVEVDERTGRLLDVLAEDRDVETNEEVLVELVREFSVRSYDESGTTTAVTLGHRETVLEGLRENDSYDFESIDDVVQAAILAYTRDDTSS